MQEGSWPNKRVLEMWYIQSTEIEKAHVCYPCLQLVQVIAESANHTDKKWADGSVPGADNHG